MKTFGLRGGYEPWNSLEAFNKAKKAKLDGVQLDVWLTSDNKLAVIHGGLNGEIFTGADQGNLNLHDFIFYKTFDELK